jgi:fructokinase
MFDVTALGELLIDFTPQGTSENGNYLFEANPGGAPCNVLAAMARLGKKTAFIGKVGNDSFGLFLKDTLKRLDIDTRGLCLSCEYFTTLAFVTLDKDGNRSFAFSRNNSADVMLDKAEVDEEIIKASKIFHCGTLSLTHPVSRAATLKALNTAKDNGVLISADPNLRLPLWKKESEAKAAIDFVLNYADIIKISDYEIEFMYGKINITEGARRVYEKYNPKILFVTCGKEGAYLLKDDVIIHHPCYDSVATVDTTGAGDCFCGAALAKLLDYSLDFSALTEENMRDILRYSNAAASLVTARYGAISAMPDNAEISELISDI